MEVHLTKSDYNKDPVHYCNKCLSLNIRYISYNNNGNDTEIDYCNKCGGTDIKTTSIEEWELLYKNKYNKQF